ncbi:precorrin-6y C5,15-methyltransferase (decarboxylating) subunit CbiE [Glycomyces sp. L485]|uniref:precorrin-6y C5,15-methyltransferase (decarboxylating) subunit CbiE n=1 Tax=Glycomyces sp. L485 TaxID=2909235 RepID=UPI001F4A6BAA|nr:precorrin-6y C5,15-methyltransferase (decarboxylating) subunit CbiE [Glycomyces sp. L485]MCH7230828.1 precorrin-6y C5,15-methyltransferase (decarboxylating) subunit CbiE [Glycomyces sp. L485]
MTAPVIVIGIGPDGRPSRPIPRDAEAVAGGKRHLAAHAPATAQAIPIAGDLDSVLERIAAVTGPVAVLASGDPGWFGILRRLAELDRPLEVHPAASSVSGAFARIGTTWEDAQVVSAHGRDPRPALATALAGAKVAVLTDAADTPSAIAQALLDSGCGPRAVTVAARLGHDDETVVHCDLPEAAGREFPDPNVMLILDPTAAGAGPTILAHNRPAAVWGRPVEDFEHRDGQITKPAVRAAALAALGPGPGRLIWDVGCGSGSVAAEAAGLGAGVIAVDADAAQIERSRANAESHGVRFGLVHGRAPAALAPLPDPDAVFIGGGGPDLEAIIDAATVRCRDRIVVALATIERVGPVMNRLEAAGWTATGQLIEVADLVPLGGGHRLDPRNPVLLVQGVRP